MVERVKDKKITGKRLKMSSSSLEQDKDASEIDETVGYGRPPKKARFKKGESGNPGGRPKGSKNSRALIYELADEMISMTNQGDMNKVSIREAIARKFLAMTLKGDHRFYKSFWDIETEQEGKIMSESERKRQEDLIKMQLMICDTFDPITEQYDLVRKKSFEE